MSELKCHKDPETGSEEHGIMLKCPSGLIGFSYHREDGPAVIDNRYRERAEEWWYHGYLYKKPEKMPLNLFLAYVKWELKKNGN